MRRREPVKTNSAQAGEILADTLLDPAIDVEPDVQLIRSPESRSGDRGLVRVRKHQFENVPIRAELISERIRGLVVNKVRRQRVAADPRNVFGDNCHVLPDLERRTEPDRHHVVFDRGKRRPIEIEYESRVNVQRNPVEKVSGKNEFNRRNVLSIVTLARKVVASFDRRPGHQ